jgi:phosphoribosylamine--glycine ligase
MRVLIAGSGGREHALAWAVTQGHPDVEVICAPGNGGTAQFARNVAIAADDPVAIVRAARAAEADLVVIGPDAALANGVADACTAAGIPVFGPTAAAARIESSKWFAKMLMDTAGVPTARWRSAGAEDRDELLGFIDDLGGRCVVKADGLALGKGVTVCDDADAARAAVAACLDEGRFGSAGTRVLVEERLVGPEVSLLALSDGVNLRVLPPARDYKRARDGDTGPNTGGMGAITPPPGLDDDLLGWVEREVLAPTIAALAEEGSPFSGCLYAGLMLTADGPRVLEFNARLGDPETQVLLPVLGEDLLDLMLSAAAGRLSPGRIALAGTGAAAAVVLAADGYPETPPRRGDAITGLDALDPAVLAFHAGTTRDADGTVRTNGGRVLTLVARGETVDDARRQAYAAAGTVHFEGMQFRRDIGTVQGET